jgi:hypothetical protein
MFTVALCVLGSWGATSSYAQVDCAKLDPRVSVSNERNVQIKGSVETLLKIAKAGGSVESKATEQIQNLQSGVPANQQDPIKLRLLYLFCGIVANAKDISTERKLQLYQEMFKLSSEATPSRQEPPTPPETAFPPPLAATRAYVVSKYGPPVFSESILVDKPKPIMDTYKLGDYTMYLMFNDSDNLVSRGIWPKTTAARKRLELTRSYYEIAEEIDLSRVFRNVGASIASYAETVALGTTSNGNRVEKVGGCDVPEMVDDFMFGDENPRGPRTPMSDSVRAEWTQWRKTHQPDIYVDIASTAGEDEGVDIDTLCRDGAP